MENRGTSRMRTVARCGTVALLPLILLAWSYAPPNMVHAQSGTMDIYVIDQEGGGGTLVVSPSGESMLIDAGFPRPDDRDAKRIYAVAQAAGLERIDNFLLTHFHGGPRGRAAGAGEADPHREILRARGDNRSAERGARRRESGIA